MPRTKKFEIPSVNHKPLDLDQEVKDLIKALKYSFKECGFTVKDFNQHVLKPIMHFE